jgi:L-ascorbate metabolism protein UlaG (beta-lactamase superfamily)
MLRHYSLEQQRRLIDMAAELMVAAGAAQPVAFRAGNMSASPQTFEALQASGIRIDSSIDAAIPHCSPELRDTMDFYHPSYVDEVACYPITVFRDGWGKERHAQIGACAVGELIQAIDLAQKLGWHHFVLLSHMHEDHFDKFVQERLARNTPILTTASAARTLRRMGFTRLYGLRTWDAVEVSKGPMRLRVRALPGTHGPLLVSAFLPDVMGSMLEFRNMDDGGEFRMYISGDTLVFDRLQEVRRQYPNIHLGLLHLGGTRVMGILVTMDAEQGIEALRIVQPDLAIPIHYNDYDVFRSSLDEFRRAVERAGLQDKVKYLQHGEIYSFTPKGMRQTVGQQPLT